MIVYSVRDKQIAEPTIMQSQQGEYMLAGYGAILQRRIVIYEWNFE